MNQRVLIVEDEREVTNAFSAYLRRAGFTVDLAVNAAVAARLHTRFSPDLVLLDVGFPSGDGLDALTVIRRRFDTPVVMLSACNDAVVKLSSFRLGADDYVSKPFDPGEVVERIKAVLRRTQGRVAHRTVAFGKLRLELDARLVTYRNEEDASEVRMLLTPTEFEILAHMARYPRRAFSRAELLEAASPGSEAVDRVVDSHVSKLRQKLALAGCRNMIEPVRGMGYRLWHQD